MMTGHFRLLSGHYVAIVYAITKILYAFNVVAQFVILNYCLKSDEYLFFGFQVRKGIFDTKLIIPTWKHSDEQKFGKAWLFLFDQCDAIYSSLDKVMQISVLNMCVKFYPNLIMINEYSRHNAKALCLQTFVRLYIPFSWKTIENR